MKMSFYERCILLTRSLSQSRKTADMIHVCGGKSLLLPCMERFNLRHNIAQGWQLLKQEKETWVLFTSVNAIECVQAVVGDAFSVLLNQHHVAAVGSTTALNLAKLGVQQVFVPEVHSQEGLLAMFQNKGFPRKIFFFRAVNARDFLQQALTEYAVEVMAIHTYQMKCPESDASEVIQILAQGKVDAVLLGSPQTVRHYLRRIQDVHIANNTTLVAISPRVAEAAQALGLNICLTAKKANFVAMLELLHHYFEKGKTL